MAFAASIYNVAVQSGLIVSSTPARLQWERQPPLASLAGLPWESSQHPVVIIVDQNGVRVDADSESELRVEVVASDRTLAAGQVEGRGPRDADGLLLGERRSKCCRGRCIFTDLAIALAGSDFQLRVSARFAPLHVLQTRVYGAAVTQASLLSHEMRVTGCFGPVTCNQRGTCASPASPSTRALAAGHGNASSTGVAVAARGKASSGASSLERRQVHTSCTIHVCVVYGIDGCAYGGKTARLSAG